MQFENLTCNFQIAEHMFESQNKKTRQNVSIVFITKSIWTD